MPELMQFLGKHLWILAIAGTWLFNNIITVLVSELPAPTKDSSAKYAYWFKVLNTIIGNLKRAQSTAIENSPNWQAAVNAHLQTLSDNGVIALALPKTPGTTNIGLPGTTNIAS
jgi:hypothetical protein